MEKRWFIPDWEERELWFSSVAADDSHAYDADKAYAHFLNRTRKAHMRTFRLRAILYGVAAVFLALLISTVSYWLGGHQVRDCFTDIVVEAPLGAKTRLVLPDSTLVWLNAGSLLLYAREFNGETRCVYLNGEANFKVAKDLEKPFIVKTEYMDIEALGTVFNVQAYSEDSCSLVTLLSGQVSLETFNEMGEKADHALLAPNQSALTDNRKGSISLINVDPSLVNAWIKGIYKFKDEPLSTIVKRLENYYNIHIHLGNSQLGQIRYTGTFSLDQDILDVFRIIDHEKQFVFTRTGNDLYIKSK